VGIFRDYPLKIWTSKQPTGEIPGYKIISSHPLKYPRSKQGLMKCKKIQTRTCKKEPYTDKIQYFTK
jgi:hypothetical protein